MFNTKCTDCGEATTVPFKPKNTRPVYCRECYSKHRTKQRENSTPSSIFNMKNAWAISGNSYPRRKTEKRSVFSRE